MQGPNSSIAGHCSDGRWHYGGTRACEHDLSLDAVRQLATLVDDLLQPLNYSPADVTVCRLRTLQVGTSACRIIHLGMHK